MTATLHADNSAPTISAQAHTHELLLLVEDDASVRRYLEVTLQRAGFTVVAVGDGLQAMRQCLGQKFDAVITDAVLPYVSGREICRFLRGHPTLATIPVILLSGFGAEALEEAAAEANAYLAKPVRPGDLIACVRRLLAEAA